MHLVSRDSVLGIRNEEQHGSSQWPRSSAQRPGVAFPPPRQRLHAARAYTVIVRYISICDGG